MDGRPAVLVVVLGLAVERSLRGQDRELCQELVIHHFERSSWFAMNAERYAERQITLPLYPALSDEEQNRVIGAVKEALGCA